MKTLSFRGPLVMLYQLPGTKPADYFPAARLPLCPYRFS